MKITNNLIEDLGPAVYQACFYVGPIIFILFSYTGIPTCIMTIYIYVQCLYNVQLKFAIVFICVLCYTSIISFVISSEKYENKLKLN